MERVDHTKPSPIEWPAHDNSPIVSRSPTTTFLFGPQKIDGHAKVHNGNTYIMKGSGSDEPRSDILRWLSRIGFRHTHEHIRAEARLPNTLGSPHNEYYAGRWLLESNVFGDWLCRKIQRLWYLGMPGAGKTVLASTIITHLLELQGTLKADDTSQRVAYLYLSYKESRTAEQLVGSVIKQLISDASDLPSPLTKLWKCCNRGDEPATLRDLSELLGELTKERQTFIVVDALDECSPDIRLRLMNAIQPQTGNISILVTSRQLNDFDEISRDFHKGEIKADNQDIELFIDHEFNSHHRLKKFSEIDPKLHDDVKSSVRDRCDGMFLLASLHMKSLASALTLSAVRERLRELPTQIDHTYDQILQRIEEADSEKKELALKTLSWIVFSCRQLKMRELQHALAIKPGSPDFDPTNIHLPDDIQDFCGGLVTVVKDVVSLVHYTAQSYFNGISDRRFPGFKSTIAKACITYLSFQVLEQPDDEENQMSYADDLVHIQEHLGTGQIHPKVVKTGQKERLTYHDKCDEFPFLHYAARFLGHHLRQLPDESLQDDILQSLMVLLQERPKRNFLIRLMHDSSIMQLTYAHSNVRFFKRDFDSYDYKCVSELPGSVLKFSPMQKQITAMHVASFLGWAPIIARFVKIKEMRLDINTLDAYDQSPLTMAVSQGHWDIVSILLKHEAVIDLLSKEGHSLLLHVAQGNRRDLVQTIISDGLHPLTHFRVYQKNWEIGQVVLVYLGFIFGFLLMPYLLFLKQEPGSNTKKEETTTSPLVANAGKSTLVRHKDHLQLLSAVESGDLKAITKLLSEGRIDLKEETMFNTTAFFLAIELNHAPVVKEFLQAGANVNMRGLENCTPLHRAAKRNAVEILHMLLKEKPEVDLRDDSGFTPWYSCLDKEHEAVLKILRRAGANPNVKGPKGVTRLYWAAAGGHLAEVQFLLECGVDPSITTDYGWTPLHWAAHNGHLACVRMLLSAGADLNPMSDQSTTPLDMARKAKEIQIASMLAEAGAKTARQVIADRVKKPGQILLDQ